ncbi:helix-turn-helix transcriptional regulator [Schnuerera sp.]|uniref:helix-turn-helix domain-containing protein n=1 Tax=Schnuerera sp. TaxID=2794844 RepID=UPI002CCF9A39|nr:helix-turn-helix transcriptional regulator [Schnuerera sp.]HSH36655.1 helix-turn-helix transcriptional regulator [Schnuerera sp.]
MTQLDSIGKRIAYLRKKKNLTQKELMNLLKFDNLSRYENDERKPNLNIIIELSQYFNVSTDWILMGKVPDCKEDFIDFIYLFNQLTSLEKGIIIGRMEEMLEKRHRS